MPIPMTIVVPRAIRDDGKINAAMRAADRVFAEAGWPAAVTYEIVDAVQAVSALYDQNLAIRYRLDELTLLGLADTAVQQDPRHQYVIFLGSFLLDGEPQPGVVRLPAKAFSLPGCAVSFISVPDSTSTVGAGDGRAWAHEIGHGLGLADVDDPDNLMSPSRNGARGGHGLSRSQHARLSWHRGRLEREGI